MFANFIDAGCFAYFIFLHFMGYDKAESNKNAAL